MSFAVSTLSNPDGSAVCSLYGFTILGSVNGPIEVSRRDELAEEATLEVNIRPAVGIGSPRDRHLESIVHPVLKQILHSGHFPRALIQLTLQILTTPNEADVQDALGHGHEDTVLPILPALISASILTFVSAALPLRIIGIPVVAFTFHAGSKHRSIALPPASSGNAPNAPFDRIVKQLRGSSDLAAMHVFLISVPDSEMLACWDEGAFSRKQWHDAWQSAASVVEDQDGDGMDVDSDSDGGVPLNADSSGDGRRLYVLQKWLSALRNNTLD